MPVSFVVKHPQVEGFPHLSHSHMTGHHPGGVLGGCLGCSPGPNLTNDLATIKQLAWERGHGTGGIHMGG